MEIEVEITGHTPLMLCRFTEEEQLKASGGSSAAATASDRGTPLQQADNRLYRGTRGQLIITSPMMLKCIVEGGSFHKAGKTKITTQKASLIYACVQIPQSEIDIIYKEPWTVDTRPVRIPATGGRILCHRPMFNDWQLRFTLELDTKIMNAKLLRLIVDDAGTRCGLGAFRPNCKGPYGVFKVTNWEEIEDKIHVPLKAAE
jgi:hypothetical protein